MILDTKTSLELIEREKVSISRFGDGEFDLIFGTSLAFQKNDAILAKRLQSLLVKYEGSGKHMIGIPIALSNLHGFTKQSKRFWLSYCSRNRKQIQQLLPNCTFLDAQISRIYINRVSRDESEQFFKLWKRIWDNKNVLIVEGSKTRFGFSNDLLSNACSVSRILCPAENCFTSYETILDTTRTHASRFDLILLVLGPTATILAKDLSDEGYWALDTGHLDIEYEWFLQRAQEKSAIPGKYTNEVPNGCKAVPDDSEEFMSQVIALCTNDFDATIR